MSFLSVSQEIERLEQFILSDQWKTLKEELLKMRFFYEIEKDKSIASNDNVNAARMLGITQGINMAINFPERLLEKKKKPTFIEQTKQFYETSRQTVQQLLSEVLFKDFPSQSEKTNNGG